MNASPGRVDKGRLAGQVALITGGGAGIGAATAAAFCAEGAQVLLADRDGDALEATARTLRERFGSASVAVLLAEVAGGRDAGTAVASALDAFGRLDILVNNAAMRNYSAVADAHADEWRAVLDVNLVGTAGFCRAALPALRASGTGSIVNVSSCYAVTGRRGMAIYDASKAAMLALTRTLAFEEAIHGVRVNAVCPGSTLTDFQVKKGEAAGVHADTLLAQRKDNSLIGRWGRPDEVAWPILWLASREASFITGTTLMVDGGLSIM